MSGLVSTALVATLVSVAASREYTYGGRWETTNRKLDGQMTCVVKYVGKERWQGRFHGTWQGMPFDYTVDFTGPVDDLRGRALIDGADYDWRGRLSRTEFKANFTGSRYLGGFDLNRVPGSQASKPR